MTKLNPELILWREHLHLSNISSHRTHLTSFQVFSWQTKLPTVISQVWKNALNLAAGEGHLR